MAKELLIDRVLLAPPFVLLLATILFSFLLGRRLRRTPAPPLTSLPPSPRRQLPLLGHLHLLGSLPHRSLRALSDGLGPVFLLQLGRVPTVVISSAAAAEEAFKDNDLAFSSRPPVSKVVAALLYGGRDVASPPYGEYWRQVRRISVLHLLSPKRVHSLAAIREEEVGCLVAKLRAAEGESVNVTELLEKLTNDVVSRAVFGKVTAPAALKETLLEFTALLGTVEVGEFVPWLRWVDWLRGLRARARRNAAAVDAILERALAIRQGGGGGGRHEGLVDVLISVAGGNEGEGFKLCRDDMKAVILDMFAAGTDTVRTAIEWTLAELINNPTKLAVAQQDVRVAVGATATSTGTAVIMNEEHVSKMKYIRAAIVEAMRLHPPIPMLVPRESTADVRLLGYNIPAGTRLLVNAWAIGHDADAWENPDEFIPERFLDVAGDHSGGTCAALRGRGFLPFGAGRRMCPGTGFAMAVAELAVASLVGHFNWELPTGTASESLVMAETSGLTAHLKSGLVLVPRLHCHAY